jgi:hypothetical protein
MRIILVLLTVITLGCSPPLSTSTDKPAQAAHAKTVAWLSELPEVFVWPRTYGVWTDLKGMEEDRKKLQPDLQFDFVGWVTKGKSIDNAKLVLIQMLQQREKDVSADRVVFALGEIGDSECVQALIDCLNRDDAGLQTKAVEALGKLRDPRAVEALATRLSFVADEKEGVQMAIIDALASIGNKEAIEYLDKASREGNQLISDRAKEQLDSLKKAHEPGANDGKP